MIDGQEQLLERILEMALKGKLILWAGAGLSMEAGYPSGGQLAELLWQRLPEVERNDLQIDLLKVSDFFVHRNDKGRDELIVLLKEIFKKKDQKSESHDVIRKMEFFNTIITTNYDELFEDHIIGIQIIKNSKQLARSKSNARKLIKIHGDLNSPKKLVLTQGDYSKLYNINQQDPFWGKINVELTEKGVLFIGYGFNDPNVRGLFDFLHKKLKKHKNPKYLIAPGLSGSEKAKLDNYDIQYLDITGKDFLNRLYQEWKTKGFKYFGSEELNTDDLINSLKHEGIKINVSSAAKGGRIIQFNPESDQEWKLTFCTRDKEVENRIAEWKKGLGSDYLNISQSSIDEADLKIGDFVVGSKNSIPDFKFIRTGIVYKKVRVVFENSGIELEDLEVKVFQYGEKGIRLIIKNQVASFEITIPRYSTRGFSYNGKFTPTEPCDSISGMLKWHEAIYALGNGESYKIFSRELPKGYRDANNGKSKNLEGLQRNRLIFQVLRKIEEKFAVRFFGLKEEDVFNEKTTNQLQRFLDLFRTNRSNWDISKGFPIKSVTGKAEEDIIPLIEGVKEDGYLIIEHDSSSYEFLGQEISLGKKQVFITNPYLENSDSEPSIMLLKSKNNECFEFYEAFGLAVFKDQTRNK